MGILNPGENEYSDIMYFWIYVSLLVIFYIFLILLILAKTKNSRPILLFAFFLFYNSTLAYYGWVNTKDKWYLIIALIQFVPLPILTLSIYIPLWCKEVFDRVQKLLFPSIKRAKYEKTGLSKSFSEELKLKLEHFMNTEKPYLYQELRLDDIAKFLDVSKHHASQVINENFELNFFDFINSYRIEYAKVILANNFNSSSDSITDIAYRCGFNNRVSFYKAFKKFTKTTPTDFISKAA